MELLENTKTNKHVIELIKGKKPLYRQIYSFILIELKTLKLYIKIHLQTGFIRPTKSPVGAPILFHKKSDHCLRLSINYWDLNNLTIKNRYLLLLIDEFLD